MNPIPAHLHILRHSLGLDDNGNGNQYRNYYCTGPDCSGRSDVVELEHAGLMKLGRVDGNNEFFYVTDAGKVAALKDVVYPKLTHSQRRMEAFRNADSGLTFGEWLKTRFGKMEY